MRQKRIAAIFFQEKRNEGERESGGGAENRDMGNRGEKKDMPTKET